mmetsp:Transcript_7679/g.7093  ORF Transcript_7679/g.7093 Transcript_7679/m.7093 type:complete len:88 (+) Transcript_7679:1587-1850(+)
MAVIPVELEDHDNGTYTVKYTVDEECEVSINILFEQQHANDSDKKNFVPIRGCPYKASFNAKSAASANTLTGPAMNKYLQQGLEEVG